jgi:hypothetical protein
VTVNWPLYREIALSLCFCTYIFFSVTWLSPDSELKTRLLAPVKLWWNFWGLNQNWALFSPVIRNINYHSIVIMTFSDGTRMIWQLPRMDKFSLVNRFRYEKFRKWDVDCLPWPDYKNFWPDFARYSGRLYYRPGNKPVQLSLHLLWNDIPAPVGVLTDRDSLPPHTRFQTQFTYFYTDKDFE